MSYRASIINYILQNNFLIQRFFKPADVSKPSWEVNYKNTAS